ncbi:expressed protein [Echinococcus multilocularis]|uniref:Expressed protein n=1 Tax=Echinococcus multilocularis TaxID=6211 RepID=A0A068XSX8_ECHMU|nr:expressed protein [Echinococcus multilocularis]
MYRPSQTPRLTMSPDRVARRTHTPTDNTTVHPPAAPAAAAAAAAAADSGQPAATEDAVTQQQQQQRQPPTNRPISRGARAAGSAHGSPYSPPATRRASATAYPTRCVAQQLACQPTGQLQAERVRLFPQPV